MSLNIGRYDQDFSSKHGWAGWIEPADRTWIAFVKTDHTIVVYLDRDPVTGVDGKWYCGSGHPTHRDPPGDAARALVMRLRSGYRNTRSTARPRSRRPRRLAVPASGGARGAIIRFDDRCPIVDRHRRPALENQQG